MSNILDRYDKAVEKIRDFDSQKDRLKGREEQLTDELAGLGFKTIEEARKWIKIADKDLKELETEIADDLGKAEEIIADAQNR